MTQQERAELVRSIRVEMKQNLDDAYYEAIQSGRKPSAQAVRDVDRGRRFRNRRVRRGRVSRRTNQGK